MEGSPVACSVRIAKPLTNHRRLRSAARVYRPFRVASSCDLPKTTALRAWKVCCSLFKESRMKIRTLPPIALLAAALTIAATAGAQELLFLDNFNTTDSASFDAAPLTGRLSGSVAGTETVLRSWGAQEQINNNQLLLPVSADSGVRWENAAGPFGAANRYSWAAGTTGASILAAGGFSVSFDYAPVDNTSTNWISFQVGTVNADSGNLTNDDYGILFRQNGNTERFDNGVNLGAGGAFTATPGGVLRSVRIDYFFNSFA